MAMVRDDEEQLLTGTTAYRQGRVDMTNGRGELMRWIVAMVLAALVSYFTTIGTLSEKVATIEATQRAQFEEIQRSLSDIKTDLRELRRGGGSR